MLDLCGVILPPVVHTTGLAPAIVTSTFFTQDEPFDITLPCVIVDLIEGFWFSDVPPLLLVLRLRPDVDLPLFCRRYFSSSKFLFWSLYFCFMSELFSRTDRDEWRALSKSFFEEGRIEIPWPMVLYSS